VDGVSQYLGAAATIPERSIADLKSVEKSLGNPDDILGPIPKAEEIRLQMESLDKMMDAEMKETKDLAQNPRTSESID
jgi:hypothetical protein